MRSMRPVDPEELKWQRRDDARTLARAEEIKADKERYDGAKIGAKEILEEETARLNGLNKVAGRKPVQKPQPEEKKQQRSVGQPLYHNPANKAKPSRSSLPADIPDVFRR